MQTRRRDAVSMIGPPTGSPGRAARGARRASMNAVAVFPRKREVRLIDQPEPKLLSPREAKVRILEVGICGTDREICTFDYGTPPEGNDYLVIGHESLGEVVEVGAAVSR